MIETLTVSRKDGKLVARVKRDRDNHLKIDTATDFVKPDLERWLKDGIAEHSWSKKSMPQDADFLERVAGYIQKLGLLVSIKRTPLNKYGK